MTTLTHRIATGNLFQPVFVKLHGPTPADLADPAVLDESGTALDELTGLLGLGGGFFPFQRV